MTNKLQDKLAKIYELVNRGATEGERLAAKKALDRIIAKYGIDESQLESITLKEYRFKYSTKMEFRLLIQLIKMFVPEALEHTHYDTFQVREIIIRLTYMNWVKLETTYEYFRRHMKKEWHRVCAPELKKCRKTKTRNKRRAELQNHFFSRYIIASKLYRDSDLIKRSDLTRSEMNDLSLMHDVEGGKYNQQITNGLLLSE